MSASWREFSSWKCQSCGQENIIVESSSDEIDEAAVFERPCSVCGVVAPGATTRPAGTAYRITTPRLFYSSRFR
jgi:predicted RNA-binding Zn-ribbon protein involved in translation (DUF1610 family)